MMSADCVFCEIIAKRSPANIVYEDDSVIAFLTNRPVNEGHTLVVPKQHYENIYEVPDELLSHLFCVVKRLSLAVKAGCEAEGIRVVQNNGLAAGQVIFHYHVHIIPLKPDEGFSRGVGYRERSKGRMPEALAADARKIRQKIP